ncbi:MAG: DEAD/DEAH box helicase, partial [Eubacteriales bacterium]
PVILSGRDMIGQAQTGTGKTAAFGIPLIQLVDVDNRNLQAIVLCPTRELAIQAAEEMRRFAKFMHGIKILPIYGGQDITKQIRSLKGEVQIVVGTPGRVMDHMRRHTLKLDHVKMMVLDEADEMLNMGFREDIETILADIPQEHQTALFSATMPKPIMDITKTYQHDAVLVKVAAKELTIPLVKQYYYEVKGKNKLEVTCRLMDYYQPKRSLIFCNTKRMVDELAESLKGRGYFAEGLHGDLSQNQRDTVMNRFRTGTADILIATDVAARGIDVDDVEAVFNYDVPQDIEYYVHRIGRTGRAGRKGRSFTLVVGREIYKVREIEQICKTKIKARTVPSAADITAVKAEKTLGEVLDILKDNDMQKMIKIIEQKLNDEDITAIELAAAFLKKHMGEEIEDIPVETYSDRRRGRYGKDDRGGRRDGRRDDRGGRNDRSKRDGKSYGRDDRSKRDGRSYDRDDRSKREGKPYDRDDRSKRDGRSYDRDDRSKREGKPYDRDDRLKRDRKSYDKDDKSKRDKKFTEKDGVAKQDKGYFSKKNDDKKHPFSKFSEEKKSKKRFDTSTEDGKRARKNSDKKFDRPDEKVKKKKRAEVQA